MIAAGAELADLMGSLVQPHLSASLASGLTRLILRGTDHSRTSDHSGDFYRSERENADYEINPQGSRSKLEQMKEGRDLPLTPALLLKLTFPYPGIGR